ncbi:cupin domain-containing protein [Catelliglobosispora koreensis]|uniref:cupin domain-containing protein n=1 Tax=Catelliglobosispora koreensis TaxID=129052 RepID=UPI00035C1A4A|nr:cupin domain-containing protein [Catelliglobosispora koreensis]
MSDLPGGVGLSHLTVYPASGSPHMHLACTEAYVVISGSGMVQTLTLRGYQETPLQTGAVVWFPPGTIHRLVNEGELKLVVLMQNSGLPEAGDAVLTFPPEHLATTEAYAKAAALPPATLGRWPGPEGQAERDQLPGTGSAVGACPLDDYLAPALVRRELAVQGFERLRDSAVDGDFAPLRQFHAAAVKLVAPQIDVWRDRWQQGALRAARATGSHIDDLAAGRAPHLSEADVFELLEPTETNRRGMCGLLNTYLIDRFLSVSN